MRAAADAVPSAFPVPAMTGETAAALLGDVLALARDWKAGLPLDQVRALSDEKERYAARRACPLDRSEPDLLLRDLFEALVRSERTGRDGGRIVDRFGVWTQAEYHAGRFGGNR